MLLYPICLQLIVLTQRNQESDGVKKGGGYDDSLFGFATSLQLDDKKLDLAITNLALRLILLQMFYQQYKIFCMCVCVNMNTV